MTFLTWREAVAALAQATAGATPRQIKLAKCRKIKIPPELPRLVCAAVLRTELAEELEEVPRDLHDYQQHALHEVRRSDDPMPSPRNAAEADAWLTHLRLRRRLESLSKLKLGVGDVVQTHSGEMGFVASIGADGRVWLQGGLGARTWPDLIQIIARRNDRSKAADNTRRDAENATAERQRRTLWSNAKAAELSEYEVKRGVEPDEIDELERAISAARDERPIQYYLERNPHLLTALLTGNRRFCISQQRLGSQYVPDFLLADVDSLGVRWVLVELETPKSNVYLKNLAELDKNARRGVSQIREWRNWLGENLGYARKPRSQEGLGLPNITSDSHALVLIGRRLGFRTITDAARRELRESNHVDLHSYDWLLDRLRGIVKFQGPPAANPYVLHRKQVRVLFDDPIQSSE